MSEKAPENSPFPRAGFTMLAPMQDVTTLPFMRLLARRGAPDFFVTEFLRVSATSPIDDSVAECAEKTLPLTGKPLLVQLLGEDVPALTRVAREVLERFAGTVAGIDFNLGCPMPKIFRRNVGGGLLRDMMAGITPYILKKHIYACASILGAMAYIYGRLLIPDSLALVIGAAVVIIVRMLATKYRWNLPVARIPKSK